MRGLICLALSVVLLGLVSVVLPAPAYASPDTLIAQAALNASLRSDYGGWVGFSFTTGHDAVVLQALARMAAPGNTGTHIVKLVDAKSGLDVPGASVSIAVAGQPANGFVYSSLTAPVTLQADTTYYLVSQEVYGGDQWYNYGAVAPGSVGSISGPVYWDNQSAWVTVPAPNTSYVPLNAQVALTSQPSTTPAASSAIPSQPVPQTRLRTDFSGWVGMNLHTGSSGLLVQSLARFAAPGNQKSHVLKLVNATTGTDVPGGSVTVNMEGSQSGAYVSAALASPVTLSANTAYLLVSQEVTGGDQWYDYGPVYAPSGASVSGSVYSANGGYVTVPAPNTSYVPLTLVATKAVSTAGGAATGSTATTGSNTTTQSQTTTQTNNPPESVGGAPTIIHVSTTVAAGETVLVVGDSFNKGSNLFGAIGWYIPPSTTASALDTSTGGTALQILQSSPTSAKVLLPPGAAPGVYALQLWNANGRSKVVYLNRAEPSWSIGNAHDVVYPGQNLRVIGRNFNAQMQAYLRVNQSSYPLTLVKGGKWSATFTVPATVPAGQYALFVHNGLGGSLGFANSLSVTVAKQPGAWPTTLFNVKAYGAAGDGKTDDSQAFLTARQNALSNHGGIIYAPPGSYLLTQPIPMPAFTELKGDSPASAKLINQTAVPTLISGNDDFRVDNLTIEASASHRVIVCPDDPQMYNDWGLGSNPASACSNVTIDNVVIQHSAPDFSLQGYALATRTLHFFGSDITVTNSTIHTQGMPTSFFNAHHVIIANNHLFDGYYCADGFWNADESIYEFNEHAAEPGTSGDGLFIQGTSRRLYFEGNYFHDSLGTYGEGIVSGDSPYQSLWYGNPGGYTDSGSSASSAISLTVPGVNWIPNQYAGQVVYIVSGKGAYQRRYVVSNTATTLTLDSAWDVPPDSTSYVSLETDHSDGIFYNNRFANVSATVLLYSQSYGFVVDGNQGEGTGGSSCLGWNFDSTRNAASPSPQRWFNHCYFNEWTNNTFSGSLNSTNPNKRGGQIAAVGQVLTGVSEYITNTAVLGPVLDPSYMDQPLTPGDYAAPIAGNIVRNNTMTAITQGTEQGSGLIGGIYNKGGSTVSCDTPIRMPQGGATDTLVEGNTVSQGSYGALFYPLYGNTLIHNNTFGTDQTPSADYGFTSCSGKTGAIPPTAPPV